MVRRHTRRRSMTETERARFVGDITKFHHGLAGYLHALEPRGSDYRAVQTLTAALRQAILDVTGDDPDWCKVQPGAYPR
ncbi:hypothetical protein [Oricola indica]|uniref:hypothetical protein n=1 Tax=Oricola indica TaxID=2872591 RepID=UPI003CCBACF5